MTIRNALLSLLATRPRYGYELHREFERHTGGAWPLNIGQVYTTLDRLARDGLAEPTAPDADGHIFYQLTSAGLAEVLRWFDEPVDRRVRARDELAIKLAMAIDAPAAEVARVLQTQREHTQASLTDLVRSKRRLAAADLAGSLVLDATIFATEAEIRWLDHCESMLRAARPTTPTPPSF